ncbi:hypothetical protein ACHAXA_000890 [Cyclostephanos tholiformis]|uniref:Uncharacterized protein n=1 Tax=Cyclostephanos tholiformis TaxID=382380 RepID=A0ABD3R7W7_9STRA
MESHESAPAAAPRRGKFLSHVPTPPLSSSSVPLASSSSSSSTQTRGKFLENKHASSIASVSDAGGIGDASERDRHDDIKSIVRNLKTAAASRRGAIEYQRRSVLNDLDTAEEIVLALLESASDVASALSEMTTARSTKGHGERRSEVEDEGASGGDSFEDLVARVRSGGAVYSSGVKRLHELLAPHAHYVKSLNERDGGASADDRNRSNESLAVASPEAAITKDSALCRTVEEAASNMYAVRVKNRLAMERCEVLRQMIQLEEDEVTKEGHEGNIVDLTQNADAASSKRKHDSIDN